jgi:ribonuclease HI
LNTATLHHWESVFRGELKAIQLALSYIETQENSGGNNSYTICSDSLSSLQAIKQIHTTDTEVQQIHDTIGKLKSLGTTITMTWVPGHEQIEGNEEADQAAKDATLDEPLKQKWSKSMIKRCAVEENNNLWQRDWDNAITGRFCYEIRKLVSNSLLFDDQDLTPQEARYIRRAVSGHFPTRSYLYRFKRANSNLCRYGCKSIEDIEHLIRFCPRFEQIRYETMNKTNKENVPTVKEFIYDQKLRKAALYTLKTIVKDKDVNGSGRTPDPGDSYSLDPEEHPATLVQSARAEGEPERIENVL